MTFRLRKRGGTYRREGRYGERAFAAGPSSLLWRELRTVLPPETFAKLAQGAGHEPERIAEVPKHTWQDLSSKFAAWMSQRVALDKMRDSTRTRYVQTCGSFGEFLTSRGIVNLVEISRAMVEDYKGWRLTRILAKRNSRGGRGVVLDAAILHRIFGYAVECELTSKNPVRLEGRPGDEPERGAQPFKAAELKKLREAAGADLLAFLLLRRTGLRRSDAVGLRWEEIDWETHEINRLTMKRRKRVLLPVHQELHFALEVERDRRRPQPEDRVLLNPTTGRPFTRPRLYERVLTVGRRAGVLEAHPHRFRDYVRRGLTLARRVALRRGETTWRHCRNDRKALRTFCARIARASASDQGNRRGPGDNRHTTGTAETRGRENQLTSKDLVAGEPISRILSGA
jgi:integrase